METDIFERLAKSAFRSKFKLSQKDKAYIAEKGILTIRKHAQEFIAKRLAPANLSNDGKQTPYKNHPVFVAQHATATCCRQCMSKWHKFAPEAELSPAQQEYAVNLIMNWIEKQL